MKDVFELREDHLKIGQKVKTSDGKVGTVRGAGKGDQKGDYIVSVDGKTMSYHKSDLTVEAKLSDREIHNKLADRNLLVKAIKTAEKMGGNMTGAVREIEKMKKGLSKHKAVQSALQQANESVELGEEKATIKTTMSDKVMSSANRFGLKATKSGNNVSISGTKGKLNDFLRAIIGRSSYGNASNITEGTLVEGTKYNKGAVDKEIKKDRRIKGKEAKAIHSLLKGRTPRKEDVELEEAADFEKMSKELLKHKSKGIEFEKAAAFARVMFMNSSLHVQDKAMKGLLTLIKGINDLTVKTTLIKILKDNGFKVKGGRVMREEVEPIIENYRTLAMHGMGTETKNSINVGRGVDYYDSTGSKRMGKITKMTRSGYVVKDEKDGKSHTFAFHDRAKAKELLAKHGKGKYNESIEEGAFMITVHKAGPRGKDLNMRVMGKDKMDAAKAFRKSNPRFKNDEISVKES